jgi:hypothetical protein
VSPVMTAPESGVTVRMYRQGLGDCFLLAFPAPGDAERPYRYVLIDCGILKNSPGEAERMRRVMDSIGAATGDHLDVLVATHEHWDHLCGFLHAADRFRKLRVDEVWLAWTEDPGHAVAQVLREKRARAFRAVQAALTRMHLSVDGAAHETAERIEAVSRFFGVTPGAEPPPGPFLGVSPTTGAALAAVRGRVERPRYCRPGEVVELPGTVGVRIYVLGPPEDPKLIRKSDPTKSGKEVYEKAFALDLEMAVLQAAEHGLAPGADLAPEDREWRDLSFPFDRRHRVPREAARGSEWFRRHYFGSEQPEDLEKGIPGRRDVAWRRIDADWLEVAAQLALQLDSDTNNTSLALAIELAGSGRVLLFPADAQVGNWLSWEKLEFQVPEAGKPDRVVTGEELVRRTVLYKVGHHASHNATLREKGLERMESPDLVALIPVDEEVARLPKGSLKKGWDMPFPPLLERLREKTRGRVIRADTGVPPKPKETPEREWNAFLGRITEAGPGERVTGSPEENRPLYIEYTVTG